MLFGVFCTMTSMVSACTAHGHETEEAATAEWPVLGSAMSYPIMTKGQCDQLT